jgi:hypothetical protein
MRSACLALVVVALLACGGDDKPSRSAGSGGTGGQGDASHGSPSHDAGEAGSQATGTHDASTDAASINTSDSGLDAGASSAHDAATASSPALPPTNAAFDYQLGGAYTPPNGVKIVSRDRTESPAAGLYNICYVNGFQVQPGEESSWDADLILRDGSGDPVIDQDWNEQLLDTSTADNRTRIAQKLDGFVDGCASAGFDAVEFDNLDSYSRSGGRLTQDGAVALLALVSKHAHAQGLAVAQKNSTELLARRAEMGTDFAVAEECSRYDECGQYIDAYGEHVLMIEYRTADFTKGCQAYGATHSIVHRDLDLVAPGDAAYVFEGC